MSAVLSTDTRSTHQQPDEGPVAWVRRFARTTPGILVLIGVLLAAGCVVAGVVSAAQLDGRVTEHDTILDQSEPFAYSAQNLYAALTAADAASASAFLTGTETGPVREQYLQALADASSALADATASATDDETRTAVAEITAQLAAYSGLVEAARANSRQGFPIGSAYLREASALMQNTLLPGAEKIYAHDLAAVDEGQRAVGSLPIVGLVLLVLVLIAIGVSGMLVSRRTNRQFNVGLSVAALLILVATGCVLIATQLASSAVEESRAEGTARFDQLAKARILAQQARTDETLLLIARGDADASDKSFYGRIDDLTALLPEGSSAGDDVQKWVAGHKEQIEVYKNGDYPAAVTQAIGTEPDASAAQFAAVEKALRDEIEDSRATLRDRVSAAGTWLVWSPAATLVLSLLAAAAVVVGLWPRLKEFL